MNIIEVLEKNVGELDWTKKEVKEQIAKYVLEKEDVDHFLSDKNENILHIAALYDATAIVIALKDRKDLMDAQDADGNTPFHVAAGGKNSHVAWLLMKEAGVDLDSAGVYGETAACVVAQKVEGRHEEFLYQIGKWFSKERVEKIGKKGSNALHYAAANNHVGLVKAFLENGVDYNIPRGDIGMVLGGQGSL